MIRLSAKTDYALRAMIDLTICQDGRTTFPAIAKRQGIPRKFLPSVLQSLAQAGLVRTVRGYGGGVELCCEPEKVSVREIIENVEGPQQLIDCEARGSDCPGRKHCPLRKVLSEAGDAMMQVLEGTMLADLVQKSSVAHHQD